MKQPITAVIIAKNEQAMLENCIESLRHWVENLIVIDCNSTDQTHSIAQNNGAKVISFESSSFSRLRNEALKYVKNGWILYIDADERATPQLANEIQNIISDNEFDVISFRRKNFCYGSELKNGGWQNDIVTRLFRVGSLIKWQGDIHESPVYEGKKFLANEMLVHLTHRSTAENLKKSSEWTILEATALSQTDCKVTFLTLIRKGFAEFFRRAILKKGYRDGMPGIIEAMVQGMNRVIVYIQVWELCNKPSLSDKYQAIEDQIKNSWQNARE